MLYIYIYILVYLMKSPLVNHRNVMQFMSSVMSNLTMVLYNLMDVVAVLQFSEKMRGNILLLQF